MIQSMTFAVILTHNRHELLPLRVEQLQDQVDMIIVYDNASDPPVELTPQPGLKVWHDPYQPANIMRSWNLAWDYIERISRQLGLEEWYVATLCDDIDVQQGWVSAIIEGMKLHNAVAGSTHAIVPINHYDVRTGPDGDIYNRMNGAAFILAGHKNIRADERMHWWWGDTDVDWQARQAGGMVITPGPVATNTQPNHYTNVKPELAEQAGRDCEVFVSKWGFRPW